MKAIYYYSSGIEVFRFYANKYGFVLHSTTVNPLEFIDNPSTDWKVQRGASSAMGSKAVEDLEGVEKLFRKAIIMIWKLK